jgi:single-strand DNA-binding protein
MNRVHLIGHIGKDPELKKSSGGKEFTVLSVATKNGKDKEGKEQTVWVNVFTWGTMAVNASNYLQKGSQVYIEGNLSNTDKGLLVTAREVQFLSGLKPKPLDAAIEIVKETFKMPAKEEYDDIPF